MRASLLLLAALGATACGGDAVRNAVDPVAEAATATQRQSSAQVKITTVGDVGGVALHGEGSGVIRFKPSGAALTMTVSAAGQDIKIDEVMDGATMYMRLPAEARQGLPDGKEWMKLDLDRATGGAVGGALGQSQDPASMLKMLRSVADAKDVGRERVGGVDTTHYHGVMDYAETAKSGPPELRKAAQLSLKYSASPTTPVDVWIDGSKRIRRQKIVLAMKAIQGTPAQTQTMTIDYGPYGVDTSQIKAPSGEKTFDATDATAQALNTE
jgi:LppX/LprAFG-like lipoprotein